MIIIITKKTNSIEGPEDDRINLSNSLFAWLSMTVSRFFFKKIECCGAFPTDVNAYYLFFLKNNSQQFLQFP